MWNTANVFCQVRYFFFVGEFFVCLFVLVFFYVFFFCFIRVLRPTREFFTNMKKSPLPVKGSKFDQFSTLKAIECCEGCHIYSEMGHSFIWSSPRTRDPHFSCRTFGTGAFTTCFNNGSLLPPVVEPVSRACEANALPSESPRYFLF